MMEEFDYFRAIVETRENYRKRDGFFSRLLGGNDRIPPLELYRTDELQRLWQYQDTLLGEGQIVWSALIQANFKLYEPGDTHPPGEVICSLDSYFDANPSALVDIAHEVFALKDTEPDDPELAETAANITDELHRTFGDPVPMSLTGGRSVVHFTVVFYREHLPYGYLREEILPVLVASGIPMAMVVPRKYWSKSLWALWQPTDEERHAQRQAAIDEKARRANSPAVLVTPRAVDMLRAYIAQAGETASSVYIRVSIHDGARTLDIDPQKVRGDIEVNVDEIRILVDRPTAGKNWGLSIDYQDTPDGGGFRIDE